MSISERYRPDDLSMWLGNASFEKSALPVEEPEFIETEDGRKLAYIWRGGNSGAPVIAFHGMPGSRLGPWPRPKRIALADASFLAYDRPGYGRSDRNPGRSIADTAADVERIADELKLEVFSVLGRSGGVAHALAAAALLPERVYRVGLIAGLAPPDVNDSEWSAGMGSSNSKKLNQEQEQTARELAELVDKMGEDTAHLPAEWWDELPQEDKEMMGSAVMMRMQKWTYEEAIRQGAGGWIDDVTAIRQPWGFDLADVKAPVQIWQGTRDPFTPVAHSQLLAEKIPNAELRLVDGESHFTSMQHTVRLAAWAVDGLKRTLEEKRRQATGQKQSRRPGI